MGRRYCKWKIKLDLGFQIREYDGLSNHALFKLLTAISTPALMGVKIVKLEQVG